MEDGGTPLRVGGSDPFGQPEQLCIASPDFEKGLAETHAAIELQKAEAESKKEDQEYTKKFEAALYVTVVLGH